jgi:hypothetical protein
MIIVHGVNVMSLYYFFDGLHFCQAPFFLHKPTIVRLDCVAVHLKEYSPGFGLFGTISVAV